MDVNRSRARPDSLQKYERDTTSPWLGSYLPMCGADGMLRTLYGLFQAPWAWQHRHGSPTEIPSEVPRNSHGNSMEALRKNENFHGISHENSGILPWDVRGIPILLSGCFHGTSVGFTWDFHRTPIVLTGPSWDNIGTTGLP